MNKRIKVFIISHLAVEKLYQKYFEELSKFKDIELVLFMPEYWPAKAGGVKLNQLLSNNFDKIYAEKKYDLNYKTIIAKMIFPGKTYHFYPLLYKHLFKEKPDIIHVIEEPWSFVLSQVLIWKKLFSKNTKVIFTTYENLYRPYSNRLFYRLINYNLIEDYNLRNYDVAIVVYSEIREILRKKGFKKTIEIIGLGVDNKLYRKVNAEKLREKLGLKEFVIGFSGRFEYSKGILILLKAASKLKRKYELLLIGWGNPDFINKMKDYAKKLNVYNKLVIIDKRLGEKVVDYMNCMDLLVVPSISTKFWKEQFGRVITEAMCCEVPVIGSSSGSIPKVIGDAGLIFKEKNDKELKEKIELVMKDIKLRKKLIKKGKERVLNNYTWDKVALKTHSLYKKLV